MQQYEWLTTMCLGIGVIATIKNTDVSVGDNHNQKDDELSRKVDEHEDVMSMKITLK